MPESMSLLGGDLVHNTRVALDHTLARLKARFGGDPGRGGFPICSTPADWQERVLDRGRGSPLHGLDGSPAFDLIHAQQPFQPDSPTPDPLVTLNRLDNDDKHRLLHLAFAYPDDDRGIDLIDVRASGQGDELDELVATRPGARARDAASAIPDPR